MFAKFSAIYFIAIFAALASASPVSIVKELSIPQFDTEVLAREVVQPASTPEIEDVEARICRFGCI
ncbi:hypothetical protein BJ138DRAFT_1114458 [Hygrophoropsis aurantiaca]|uniref:Uncharacterized protein n=1 Tax=Hygrophoropsis aurantiaca TaxID=72124 RepID=A0ACB8A999_9AGAM|nr:hypothetical protein BJ138DRAFT_1114458 [Hygrophoropsis aurantiaca]